MSKFVQEGVRHAIGKMKKDKAQVMADLLRKYFKKKKEKQLLMLNENIHLDINQYK